MRIVLLLALVVSLAVLAGCGSGQATQKLEKRDPKLQYVDTDTGRWLIHDMNRPRPEIITIGSKWRAALIRPIVCLP